MISTNGFREGRTARDSDAHLLQGDRGNFHDVQLRSGEKDLVHRHQKSDGSLIESDTYTRDEAGNITKRVHGSDSRNTYWEYDLADQMPR